MLRMHTFFDTRFKAHATFSTIEHNKLISPSVSAHTGNVQFTHHATLINRH